MRTLRSVGVVSLGWVMLAGCAVSVPPQDLLSARNAYQRASQGAAPTVAPKDLDVARKQLAVAEASFTDDGDTQHTRDQAYLALRKAEFAEVITRTKQAEQSAGATVDAM